MQLSKEQLQKKDMLMALNFIHSGDDTVFEVSAFEVVVSKHEAWENEWVKPSGSVTGYYTDKNLAVEKAFDLDSIGPKMITTTVNPCHPGLLARANQRVKPSGTRTTDEEILSIQNLFIDFDSIRPSGISATNSEKKKAQNKSTKVRKYLTSIGFSEPLEADSSNGTHQVHKVDLPNNEESCILIKNCLEALSDMFSDDDVKIDTKVGNPGRLIKLYGTHTRKGDPLPERPHRLSKIISCPATLEIVDIEILKSLAAKAHTNAGHKETIKKTNNQKGQVSSNNHNFNVVEYLSHYGYENLETVRKGEVTLHILPVCLFDTTHKPDKASIGQKDNGMLIYRCFHDSCSEKTWKEAKQIISGDDDLAPFMKKTQSAERKSKRTTRVNPKIISAKELGKKTYKPLQWIVDKMLTSGFSLLAGKYKIGKSWWVLDLGISIATGRPVFNNLSVTEGSVLYLALEDTQRRLQERMWKLYGTNEFPEKLNFSTDWNTINNGGLDDLRNWLTETPDAQLIIIDTLAKIRGGGGKSKDIYLSDTEFISNLKSLADEFGVCILMVHHLRKTGADDPFDKISGSTGYTGAADTILMLGKSRFSGSGKLEITGRDVEEMAFSMEFDSTKCKWKMLGEYQGSNENDREKRIIDLLQKSGKSMRSKDIESVLAAEGLNGNTVRGLLSDMCNKGILFRIEKGIYNLEPVCKSKTKKNKRTKTETNETKKQETVDVGFVSVVSFDVDNENYLEPDLPPISDHGEIIYERTEEEIQFDAAQVGSSNFEWEQEQLCPTGKCLSCRNIVCDITDDGCELSLCKTNGNRFINPDMATDCRCFQAVH